MVGEDASLVVRFDPAVPDFVRKEFVRTAERATGLTPKVGWDLGHLGPDDQVTMTLAVFTATNLADLDQRIGALETSVRELLAGTGGVRVELKNATTGRNVRFEADDSDDALKSARDVLARWRGDEAERPRAARIEAKEALTILAVCDEWFPGTGGISAFNRYLCRALASAGHTVLGLVPTSSAAERQDAEDGGVLLINAPPAFGGSPLEALMRKPDLPVGVVPNVVIGHSRYTGPAARVLVEGFYPDAARLHFVHMHPDRTEWGKADRKDAALTTEQATRQERDLCEGATRTIAVGPRLYDYALSKLTYPRHVPDAVQIVPGFDGVVPARRERLGPALVMVMGRVRNENKGLALAAKSVGRAITVLGHSENDLEMYVRGVPVGEGEEVRDALLEWSGVPGLITPIRNYTEHPAEVLDDLAVTSLLLMPSREEDFGLVGWEAMCAGVPVLVSARSGLGTLLLAGDLPKDLTARVVLDVRKNDIVDVPLWANHISRVLHNRDAAFDTAQEVLAIMAKRHTWAAAVAVVEDAVRRG